MEHRWPAKLRASGRWRTALVSFAVCIVPMLIVGFSAAYISKVNMQETIDRHHEARLNQTHVQINEFIRSLHLVSIGLGSNQAVERSVRAGATIDNLGQTLEMMQAVQRAQNFSQLKFRTSLVYVRQQHVYTSAEAFSKSAVPFLEMVAEHKPLYNSPFIVMPDYYRNQPDLLLFRPVPLSSNYTQGILVIHIVMNDVVAFLQHLSPEHDSKLFIVDDVGKVVASKQREDIGVRLPDNTFRRATGGHPVGLPRIAWNDTDYVVSAQRSSFYNWTYIVMTPVRALNSGSADVLAVTAAMAALMSLAVAALSIFGVERLYLPIRQLLHKFVPGHIRNGPIPGSLNELDNFVHNTLLSNNELKRLIDAQAPQLTQHFYRRLLLGELSDGDIVEGFERHAVPLRSGPFFVCVAAVDREADFMQTYKGEERSRMHMSLRGVAEDMIGQAFPCASATPLPGQVAVIVDAGDASVAGATSAADTTSAGGTAGETGAAGEVGEADGAERVRSLCDRIRERTKAVHSLTVTIAVSGPHAGFAGIHDGYMQALDLLKQRLLYGPDSTVAVRADLPGRPAASHETERLPAAETTPKQIADQALRGHPEQARQLLSSWLSAQIRHAPNAEAVLGAVAHLLGELTGALEKAGCKPDASADPNRELYQRLHALTALPELEDWLSREVFPAAREQLARVEANRQAVVVRNVRRYMDEHIDRDLSLQRLSDEFGISPAYLSRMFKEETGRTFSGYLFELRMNQAKTWLEHTEMPVREIAEKLQYMSVTHFTRVFKQVAGASPGQYRRKSRQ